MPTAQEMYDAYLNAENELLAGGQSVELKGEKVTMADLAEIRRGRREWEHKANIEALKARGKRPGAAIASFN